MYERGLGERRGSVPVVSAVGQEENMADPPSTPSRLAVSTFAFFPIICQILLLLLSGKKEVLNPRFAITLWVYQSMIKVKS